MSAHSEISDAKAKAKMAKPLHLPSLVIKNFRGLEDVEIDPLGRVNLLVGGNNSGKTSVLEAVRLWATRGSLAAFLEILGARDEDSMGQSGLPSDNPSRLDLAGILDLFAGYPESPEKTDLMAIGPKGNDRRLEMQVIPAGGANGHESTDMLVVHHDGDIIAKRDIYEDMSRSLRSTLLKGRNGEHPDFAIPSLFVSAGAPDRGDPLLSLLWDPVSLTSKSDRVIECLRLVDPRVARIGFLDSRSVNPVFSRLEQPARRVPVCTLTGTERPIPLQNLGDGVSRVFRLILSLISAENGVFLIDEFENGLHYSIQEEVWKTVFEIAEELNIQVFATTHSWDCVDAFDRVSAARGREREGVVVRLTKRDGSVYAKPFFGRKLHNLVEMEEELR